MKMKIKWRPKYKEKSMSWGYIDGSLDTTVTFGPSSTSTVTWVTIDMSPGGQITYIDDNGEEKVWGRGLQ